MAWAIGASQPDDWAIGASQPTAAGVIKELTGVTVGQSVVSGTIDVNRKIAGTTAVQSVVTGTIDVSRKVTGTVASQSSISGSIKVTRELISVAIVATSNVTGSISGIWVVAGTVAGQSTVSGTVNVSRKLVGTIAGQSVVTGSIEEPLVGSIDSQSVVSGGIKTLRELTSTVAIQSSVSGTLGGTWLIAGTIGAQSSIAGSLLAAPKGFSNFAENKVLDHILGKTAFGKPTAYIGFCTADPGEGATGANCNEVPNTNGYGRIATTGADWNPASGGNVDNTNNITSPEATGNWGEITHYILVDSPTFGSGNVLVYDELDIAKTIEAGDLIEFAAGELNLVLG